MLNVKKCKASDALAIGASPSATATVMFIGSKPVLSRLTPVFQTKEAGAESMYSINWSNLTHPIHQRLVREFMTLTVGGAVPLRSKFLPENTAYALPNVFLSDVDDLEGEVAISPRIVGENMINLFGANWTGKNIMTQYSQEIADYQRRVFKTMFKLPCLCVDLFEVRARSGLLRRVERLTMPFQGPDEKRSVLASYQPLDSAGYAEHGGISIGAVLDSAFFTHIDGEAVFD